MQQTPALRANSGSRARVATTLSAQRHHRRQQTPYSRSTIGVSARTSAQCATRTRPIATVPPISHTPEASHELCLPDDAVTEAMLAGANYANHVYAQVVHGRIVPPPPVQSLTPANHWRAEKPLVNWFGVPSGSAYGSLGVPCEPYVELASPAYSAPAPFDPISKQGHNPEDEVFDIEALERSLANSPTSSTYSSLSGALGDSYDTPAWAVRARDVDALPAQYSGVTSIGAQTSAPEPEGVIWHTDPGAYHMAAVEPTLNVNACLDAAIVDGHVNPFAGTSSVDPLPSLMSADYLDMSQALWLLELFDDFPTDQSIDLSFATSSLHYQQHQRAGHFVLPNPYLL